MEPEQEFQAINYWVLISQAVNFALLLFILNHFLFKPIGKIIEQRRDSLKQIKDEAEADAAKAKALKEDYENRIANIETEAEEIRKQAVVKAEHQCKDIVEEAKAKAEQYISESEITILMERQAAWAQLRDGVIQVTMDATQKIVEESLNEDLQHRIITRSINQLEHDIHDMDLGHKRRKKNKA